MSTLCAMGNIVVEDRTTESAEDKLDRESINVGQLVVGFTIQVSGARPAVGLGALAYAIGMGSARTGASLNDVIAEIKRHYEGTHTAMREEADAAEADALKGTSNA